MRVLLKSHYDINVEKEDFLKLEKDLLVQLNFDLQYISPLSFLERFERLFNIDLKHDPKQTNRFPTYA